MMRRGRREFGMSIVPIHAAKVNLSKLIARVEAGKEIIIAKGKTPVARLMPIRRREARRQFGALKGIVFVGVAFFEPLPEEEMSGWG